MALPETSLQRAWRDLGKWRLVGGLMLAACVLWMVSGATLVLDPDPLPHPVGAVAFVLIVVEVWFCALGLAYLFLVVRRSGILRRRDCFLLGTLLTSLFPPLVVVIMAWISPDPESPDFPWAFEGVAIGVGILLIPFGLLTGWIFWRVGVRPARAQDIDSAPVFD